MSHRHWHGDNRDSTGSGGGERRCSLVGLSPCPVQSPLPCAISLALCDLPCPVRSPLPCAIWRYLRGDNVRTELNSRRPRWLSGEESACQCLPVQGSRVQSLGQEDPLEEGWQPIPILLPGEFHGQRSPGGHGL